MIFSSSVKISLLSSIYDNGSVLSCLPFCLGESHAIIISQSLIPGFKKRRDCVSSDELQSCYKGSGNLYRPRSLLKQGDNALGTVRLPVRQWTLSRNFRTPKNFDPLAPRLNRATVYTGSNLGYFKWRMDDKAMVKIACSILFKGLAPLPFLSLNFWTCNIDKHCKDWAAETIQHRIKNVKYPFRISKVVKGAVIIYSRGWGGANLKMVCTPNLPPPPQNSRPLHLLALKCLPPLVSIAPLP